MTRRELIKTLGIAGVTLPALSGMTVLNEELILTGIERPLLRGKDFLLRPAAAADFEAMQKEALKSGINLYSVSSYRNFDRQAGIWNRKYGNYTGKGMPPAQAISKIIEYSTIPGTSRHHWGTDLDIIDANVKYTGDPLNADKFTANGVFEKMYEWMRQNASRFGFEEVYTNSKERTGFNYEPWHYTHAPTSILLLKRFLEIDIAKMLNKHPINGHQYLDNQFLLAYTQSHVLGINPKLM